MPDGLVVLLGILGIALIGFIFSAIDIVKGFFRFAFFGVIALLLVVLVRQLPTSLESGPPSSQLPPGESFPTDPNFPYSNGTLQPPGTGDGAAGSNDNLSDYLNDLAENIDRFIFGDSDQTASEAAPGQDDLLILLPDDQGTVADQPGGQRSGSQPSFGSTGSSARRPVAGMW